MGNQNFIHKIINDNSNQNYEFDDSLDLLNNSEDLSKLFNYKIAYVGIFFNKNNKNETFGLQLTYRNLKTKELIPLLERGYSQIQEKKKFKLSKGEYLCGFSYWKEDNKITQIKFETNQNRQIQEGIETGEEVKIISKDEGDNIILGTYGFPNNIGIIYINISEIIKLYYAGYSELKLKLNRDMEFKKEIEDKYNAFNDVDKCIIRTAQLPSNVFITILKYLLPKNNY